LVAEGYDRLVERYVEWARADVRDFVRERYLQLVEMRVPQGGRILDLGCGSGELATRRLAGRFQVTGVDISPRQIAAARAAIPEATFICADMSALRLPTQSYAAVVAFYSLNHLPREELRPLLAAIAAWLRPGGLLVASLPTGDDPGSIEPDWLGVPMFFSGFDLSASRRLVESAGFAIERLRPETIEENGRPVSFVWLVATTPALSADATSDPGAARPAPAPSPGPAT
jgi:SAM-dependent methyltransferase